MWDCRQVVHPLYIIAHLRRFDADFRDVWMLSHSKSQRVLYVLAHNLNQTYQVLTFSGLDKCDTFSE